MFRCLQNIASSWTVVLAFFPFVDVYLPGNTILISNYLSKIHDKQTEYNKIFHFAQSRSVALTLNCLYMETNVASCQQ